MVDLSSEDIDKIVKKVYAKISEAMLSSGTAEPTKCPEGYTHGCPSQTVFGCDIGSFLCKGKGFKCSPQYVGFEGIERI
jgi:hypothetical protein